MANLNFAASQIQSTINMLTTADGAAADATKWTDTKYPSAKAVVNKITEMASSANYPSGSILITSTNVNPAATFGGAWTLVDKEYSTTVGVVNNDHWTPSMSGATPYAELSGFVIRTDHLIHLTMQFTTKAQISLTSNNSQSLGTVDHTKIGGISNRPMFFGYTGSHFAHATYANGSTTEGCIIKYGFGATGYITIDGIFNTNKQLPIGATIYINVSIPMDPEYMGDSFCDKFYWKRTGAQADMFGPADVQVIEELAYSLSEDGGSYSVSGLGTYKDTAIDTNIVIPASYEGLPVTSISPYAFAYCSRFAGIVIPNSVTSISSEAFYNCTRLTSVYYEGSENEWKAISIGDSNSYLTEATCYYYSESEPTTAGKFWHYVSDSIEIWPEGSLEFTSNGDGTCSVTGIGSYVDTYIDIPEKSQTGDSVVSIGKDAFSGCTDITYVYIPESVTSIGDYAFQGCTSLEGIDASVTSIGNYAFADCDTITRINLPGSVTSIGDSAFEDCNSLMLVHIPESVTSIGDNAFNACASDLLIICDCTEDQMPEGWSSSWCPADTKITWGSVV